MPRLLCLLLLLPLLCCGMAARAAEAVLELRAEVLLEHGRMRLADLAQIQAPTAALRQALEELPLGAAPLAGYLDQRGRAELEVAVRGLALGAGTDIVWRGAQRVRIRRASQLVDQDRLLALASAQLRQDYRLDGMDISLAAPLPPLAAPAGVLEYRTRPAVAGPLRPRMPVWVEVWAEGEPYRSVALVLQVRGQRTVYVARRALAAGAVAAADDFAPRGMALELAPEQALDAATLAAGGRLRQALAAGEVATAQALAPAGMVLRGDRVRLQAGGAGIAVETSAYAQADGAPGQRIRVRPERGTEAVMAWVVAPGVVRVEGL